jgi:hypothetical protein
MDDSIGFVYIAVHELMITEWVIHLLMKRSCGCASSIHAGRRSLLSLFITGGLFKNDFLAEFEPFVVHYGWIFG